MSFFRVNDKCNGCLACVQNCPASALDYEDQGAKRKLLHNMTLCARCGNCWRICPQGAIEFQHLLRGDWQEVATMDLVRCTVCGDPIHTMDLGESLKEKLELKVEALCPKHRKAQAFMVWKNLFPERGRQKGVEN